MEKALPAIPAKRYFTIGEVSELCGVKPYVLRYWEQEFTQLRPVKRRGNRRYYQHHEVLLIRRIRELLYDQGFTISGARNRLAESANGAKSQVEPISRAIELAPSGLPSMEQSSDEVRVFAPEQVQPLPMPDVAEIDLTALRLELLAIRRLLTP
jgi:DNA-binding transcriptional MerR regulator